MSIQAPQGILNIPNATLRVGKLAVDEVVGADTILNTVARNTILLVDDDTYDENKNWALKLPNAWAGEFECNTASAGNFSEFNFYNEGASSNAQGYNLTFNDTAVELRYDGTLLTSGTLASTVTGTGVKKVRLMFERTILSVTVDGTLIFTHDDTGGPRPRVYSTTAGGFLNFFTDGGALKNLKIVNEKWMSDGTSNIAYVGGGEVAVGKALAFNRVSNVSQIKVDSNVVTEYTGPHDRPLRKYPEVAMTSASQGGYVVTASSQNTGASREGFNLFDNSITTVWQAGSADNHYSGTTPFAYDVIGPSSITDVDNTIHRGAYIKLQLPKRIRLSHVIQRDDSDPAERVPGVVAILGSNDGTNWTFLKEFTGLSATQSIQQLNVNSTGYYNHYAYLVKNLADGDLALMIGELEYYGHEEGSASLDTTLKSVYNVPATTGTQLEVYYDAKDLADGAVTSVLGLGGTTINATVYGDPQVSGGAFVFDGTGDYIKTSALPSTFVDDAQHSFSTWFKLDTTTGSQTLFTIGNADGDNELPHVVVQDGTLRYDFYNNSRTLLDLSLVPNQWYHLAITFSGGNHNSGTKFYINGMYDANVNSGGNNPNATLDIQASSPLTIGGRHNGTQLVAGSIANFRLYSKALNTDQVKELYDYQKDYFLGSKSQVTLYKGHLGVGVTEPSGQLELAGDERIQEYPPRGMTNFDTHIEGHGVFTASASSVFSSDEIRQAYQAFNGGTDIVNDDAWISKNDRYTSGLPNANAALINGVAGEWLGIQFPYPIKLKQIAIQNRAGAYNNRSPDSGILWGSNDGTEYEQVVSWSGLSFVTNGSTPSYVTINATNTYRFFRLQGTKVVDANTSDFLAIGELKFFGTPGPTTLDKGSLSLTRSLDVPRISRYDVDTETPRPEKLVLDFDTTVNSSPTDISGQGNHGTFYNGASYSAADKAFNFDGTDDYIRGTLGGVLGSDLNTSYTISLWVKNSSTTNFNSVFAFIGTSGATGGANAIGFRHDGATTSYTLYHFGISDANFTGLPSTLNTWRHLVAIFDGTTQKVYIDGVLGGTHTSSGTMNIPNNPTFSIGYRHDTAGTPELLHGMVSNPKIYSVALEPSEVKKLYNLGRTGRSMVISDTAVGIGKVPEAQLDVRGVANFGSRVGIGTTNPKTPLEVRQSYGYFNSMYIQKYLGAGPELDTSYVLLLKSESSNPKRFSGKISGVRGYSSNNNAFEAEIIAGVGSTAALSGRMTFTYSGNSDRFYAKLVSLTYNSSTYIALALIPTANYNGMSGGIYFNGKTNAIDELQYITNLNTLSNIVDFPVSGGDKTAFTGNVGIGVTNPDYKLKLYATGNHVGWFENNTNSCYISCRNSAGTMGYIGADGSGFISSETNSMGLYNTGDGNINYFTNGARRAYLDSAGKFLAQSFGIYSDERIKDNITDVDDEESLEIIKQLQPKNYVMRENRDVKRWGFIANDVEQILSEVVSSDSTAKVYIKKKYEIISYNPPVKLSDVVYSNVSISTYSNLDTNTQVYYSGPDSSNTYYSNIVSEAVYSKSNVSALITDEVFDTGDCIQLSVDETYSLNVCHVHITSVSNNVYVFQDDGCMVADDKDLVDMNLTDYIYVKSKDIDKVKTIDYEFMNPVLISAVQQLIRTIDDLKERVTVLENT